MYVEKEEAFAGAAGIGVVAAGKSAATMTGGLATVGALLGGGIAVAAAAAFGITKFVKQRIRGW